MRIEIVPISQSESLTRRWRAVIDTPSRLAFILVNIWDKCIIYFATSRHTMWCIFEWWKDVSVEWISIADFQPQQGVCLHCYCFGKHWIWLCENRREQIQFVCTILVVTKIKHLKTKESLMNSYCEKEALPLIAYEITSMRVYCVWFVSCRLTRAYRMWSA